LFGTDAIYELLTISHCWMQLKTVTSAVSTVLTQGITLMRRTDFQSLPHFAHNF
jgi:hypothetical protein